MSIKLKVRGQKLKLQDPTNIFVSGTQEFVEFEFDLDESWKDLLVFAQFKQKGEAYNQYLSEDNKAYLPAEIAAGTCYLTLCGTKDNTVANTNTLAFTVRKSKLTEDGKSTVISQTLYEQLVNRIEWGDALGIDRIEQTGKSEEDEGENVITVYFTDETEKSFTIRNGSKGDTGDKGEQGEKGAQGIQGIQGEKGDKGEKGERGEQGLKGDKGETGAQGLQGEKGDTGEKGSDGADGYSPTVAVSKSDGVTTVTITDKDGTKTAEIKDGESKGTNRWSDGSGSYAIKGNRASDAAGYASLAEGYSTQAIGTSSHAEGGSTVASGAYSHAEGSSTIASGRVQHVQGQFNEADSADVYAHIVGGGSSNSKRKNIHTLDWSGNTWYSGDGTFTIDGTEYKISQIISAIKALGGTFE